MRGEQHVGDLLDRLDLMLGEALPLALAGPRVGVAPGEDLALLEPVPVVAPQVPPVAHLDTDRPLVRSLLAVLETELLAHMPRGPVGIHGLDDVAVLPADGEVS